MTNVSNAIGKDVLLGISTVILMILTMRVPVTVASEAPAAAATNFSGIWSLDIYLSDNSEQVARALQFDTGEFSPETFGRGTESPGTGGAGREGTRRGQLGDFGRQRAGRDSAREPQMSADDRKKLTELTRAVRLAPLTLTISQTETELTIATGVGAPQTFHTNRRAETHHLDSGTINRTATWEGPQLLVAYEVGHAGTLTYTYSLVPTTKQLLIRVNFERRRGEPGPFEIKLVYNPSAP